MNVRLFILGISILFGGIACSKLSENNQAQLSQASKLPASQKAPKTSQAPQADRSQNKAQIQNKALDASKANNFVLARSNTVKPLTSLFSTKTVIVPGHSSNEIETDFIPHPVDKFASVDAMLHCALGLFLEGEGNGFSRMPIVLGEMPTKLLTMNNQDYEIASIELIGTPADIQAFAYHSYDSAYKIRAERKLSEFESMAIKKANSGENIVTNKEEVYGAIRAQEDCLGCHPDRKTEDMLGGLSFKLTLIEDAHSE